MPALRPAPVLRILAALAAVAALALTPTAARAAVGCSLNDPERDLRRFFPELTDFRTSYLTFERQDPEAWETLEDALGGSLDALYEPRDVPYTLYEVDAGSRRLGYVFGANQRGTYSNIQVIVVTDADLDLQRVYLQKIRSPAYERFQSRDFAEALAAVPLEDYPGFVACWTGGRCDAVPVEDPTGGEEAEDYRYVLRGLAKLSHLRRLLLRPGEAVPTKDRAAAAERVATWWDGRALPPEAPESRWVAVGRAPDLPADVPVLAWPAGRRIYPLPALRAWPVAEHEADGRRVAATWSPLSRTALLLEGSGFQATDAVLFGTAVVVDEATRSEWSPVLGTCLRGEAAGRDLRRVPGALVVPWGLAKRLLPRARVLVRETPEDPAAAWEAFEARYGAADDADRLVVVDTGRAQVGLQPEALPERGVRTIAVGDTPVAVVRHAGATAAFRARREGRSLDLRRVAFDPWTGTPWLWDAETGGLWEGLTGRPLNEAAGEALAPMLAYSLPERTFRSLLPEAPVQAGAGEDAGAP